MLRELTLRSITDRQDRGCVDVDASVFYPRRLTPGAVDYAKQFCERCPITDDCRAYALTHALEPVVGVYGLRTFRVSLDGKLLPIGHLSDDWDRGRCIARCAIGGDHTAPETDCTCGIYSFRDRVHLTKQFPPAHSLIAVVALEGTTVEGDRGWRSQAAQVVAVWIADDALPSSLRAALLAGLPNVREYTSPSEMIADFPSLTCSEGYPPAESLPRRQPSRRASTRIPGEFRRWSLALAANFLLSVGIKT